MKDKLRYDPDTGKFFWLANVSTRVKAGDKAGCVKSDGYVSICVNKKYYKAHRLAWYFTHGVWPTGQLDHINGNRIDNRISNLCSVTSAQNHQNRKKPTTNTSGYVGVYKDVSGKWAARIRVKPHRIFLGLFETPEAAACAYTEAKNQYHAYHPTPVNR
jgi:hypothetical protein